jgi:hypothetical protein
VQRTAAIFTIAGATNGGRGVAASRAERSIAIKVAGIRR